MITPQGRYEFLETLGTGATSRVDKARDTLIGRTVALKTFLHGFGSGDVQKQFLREAQIIGRLAHPFIVGLYDVGTNAEGVPYFVMEYVDGRTLEKVLDDGPLPLEKAALWATDLAAAIARAHRAKVIHGDIKPANILITREGQVKLGDFGIARFATQVSNSGVLMGTPAYLSPEQIQGNAQDTRSDLFSLGIILYQMTTGVQPFSGSSVSAVCAQIVAIMPPPPSHHNSSLPAAFDRIVMRCLAKDPADRYATAEALGASLYPFAHAQEMAAVVPEKPSTVAEFVGTRGKVGFHGKEGTEGRSARAIATFDLFGNGDLDFRCGVVESSDAAQRFVGRGDCRGVAGRAGAHGSRVTKSRACSAGGISGDGKRCSYFAHGVECQFSGAY